MITREHSRWAVAFIERFKNWLISSQNSIKNVSTSPRSVRSHQHCDLPDPYWSSFNCRWVASALWRTCTMKNSSIPDTHKLPSYCRLLLFFRWACSFLWTIAVCHQKGDHSVWQGRWRQEAKLNYYRFLLSCVTCVACTGFSFLQYSPFLFSRWNI